MIKVLTVYFFVPKYHNLQYDRLLCEIEFLIPFSLFEFKKIEYHNYFIMIGKIVNIKYVTCQPHTIL